jgi:hypothetical protein
MKISVLVFVFCCLLSAAATSFAQINLPLLGIGPLGTAPSKPAMKMAFPDEDSDFEPMTRTGIVPDMDQTQDFALRRAFRIFGNLSGDQALAIAAIRDDGTVFRGFINSSSGTYAIVVPAGTYGLRTCYGSPTTATYDDPAPVTVAADTPRDESLAAITGYGVSGTVTGLDPSVFGQIAFVSQDRTTGSSTFIFPGVGSYSVNLPSGVYSTFVVQIDIVSGSLSSSPVGTVTVVDSAIAMDFAVGPMAQLSGTVMKSSIPPNSNMIALESPVMPVSGFNCVSTSGSTGIAPVNQSTGAYQMTILTGRSYFLLGNFAILPPDPPQTAVIYQSVDPMTVDFQGDTVRDATVSPPTDTIVISGQISVASGGGIADIAGYLAIVEAACRSSSTGTGAPSTAFVRATQTDSAGNYRLVLPRDPSFQCTLTVNGPQPAPP